MTRNFLFLIPLFLFFFLLIHVPKAQAACITVSNGTGCSMLVCDGTIYGPFCTPAPTPTPPPSGSFNGYTQTNQTCNSQGQWVTTTSVCVASCTTATPTPLPDCNTNGCGLCNAVCGPGTQTCHYTAFTGGGNCNIKDRTIACNNGPCATYTISGNVFLDNNKNTIKDAGETNYTGTITISSTGGSVTTSLGSYTVSGLNAGTYTVSYMNLPTGYSLTYPVNGPPPSFTVTVGGGCSVGGSNSASCSGGSLINLNFGITNSNPWIQALGNDARIDAGFNDPIPQGALCGSYASIPGLQSAPGVIFSGASSYSFGQGQASQNPYNWVAGGLTYPETYGPIKTGGLIKTGFAYLQSKASQAGLTITDISAYCTGGIANCTLSGTIPHGVYQASGSMTIAQGYTFPAGQNYVILVNGDLTIKGKIFVPNGSTAVFSASGNINIDKSVGESTVSSTASDIEGIYSSDKSFMVQGTNNCSLGTDLRLNVAGAVITNAAGAGGSFTNLRDLCAGNVSCPAFSAISRPDLILNTADFMKQANFTYQEIAP